MVLIPIFHNELTIKDASKGIPADGRIPRRIPPGMDPIGNRAAPRTRIVAISESPEPDNGHEAIENGERNRSVIRNDNINGDRHTSREDEEDDNDDLDPTRNTQQHCESNGKVGQTDRRSSVEGTRSSATKTNGQDKGKGKAKESTVDVDGEYFNRNGSLQRNHAESSNQTKVGEVNGKQNVKESLTGPVGSNDQENGQRKRSASLEDAGNPADTNGNGTENRSAKKNKTSDSQLEG